MKKIISLLLIPISVFSQYSNYYNVDVNSNSYVSGSVRVNQNINKNINVSGHTTQTINTIDYGALARANALNESNRIQQRKIDLENAKYRDQKSKENALLNAKIELEIAENPLKAHTYGTRKTFNHNYLNKGWHTLILNGYKSFTNTFIIPHNSLFQNVGQGRWENISTDGITTEMISSLPSHNYMKTPYCNYKDRQKIYKRGNELYNIYQTTKKPLKKDYKNNKTKYQIDLDKYYKICDSIESGVCILDLNSIVKMYDVQEGKMFPSATDSAFCHKKMAVKRTVFGKPGFRYSLIWEDDYEICITDNYASYYNETYYFFKVRYKADKESNITFEELEGRRYYLSKFIDKHVATRVISNEVFYTDDPKKPKRRNYSSALDFQNAYKKWYDSFINP